MSPGPHVVERVVALVLLVVVAPLLVVLAVAVVLGDGGPPFVVLRRSGAGGRPFGLVKLRTMRPTRGGSALTAPGDRRVTAVGRLLRRHRLDELPQLVHVVRGEMGFVGPRPEDPALLAALGEPVDWFPRPGITGLTQLVAADVEASRRFTEVEYVAALLPLKLALDRHWATTRSRRLDALLLLATVDFSLGGHGPFLHRARAAAGPLAADLAALRDGAAPPPTTSGAVGGTAVA